MRIQLHRILCTTDFSEPSNRTLPYGAALAREFDARLYVCHVIDLQFTAVYGAVHFLPPEAQQQHMDDAMARISDIMSRYRIDWEPVVSVGHATDEISRVVEDQRMDLVIAATHGRAGLKRLVLGSVTERLMRSVTCPLLVVGPGTDAPSSLEAEPLKFDRILVGCDFSAHSAEAVKYGLNLAQEFQSELHLVHVVEAASDYDVIGIRQKLDDMPDRFDERVNVALRNMVPEEAHNWCRVVPGLLEGRPYRALAEYADRIDAGMIVVGVRGVGLMESLLMGSTTDRLIRCSNCPVLSLPSAGETG